jgi:hypothetical protein
VKHLQQKKWAIPDCVATFGVTEKDFLKWLDAKARAHVIRDVARGRNVTVSQYKQQILEAVAATNGCDYYTGEPLAWESISKWNNDEAKLGRAAYRKKFWNLPTIDHDHDELGVQVFRVCSWRMNDAKNDQTLAEFLELAAKVSNRHFKPTL